MNSKYDILFKNHVPDDGIFKNLTGHLTWVPFVSLLVKISWMCSRNVLCRGFSNAYVRSKVFEFKRIRLFGTGKLFFYVI